MKYTREQAEQVRKDWQESGFSLFADFIKHKFPQLPERGWLKHQCGSIIFRTGARSGYGLNLGKWEIDDYWTFDCPELWQPATKKEVIAMLTEQAEKMGYVGAKVISLCSDRKGTLISVQSNQAFIHNGIFFFADTFNRSIAIMKDGKWAEIIDDDLQERFDALVKEAKEKGKNVTVKFE